MAKLTGKFSSRDLGLSHHLDRSLQAGTLPAAGYLPACHDSDHTLVAYKVMLNKRGDLLACA